MELCVSYLFNLPVDILKESSQINTRLTLDECRKIQRYKLTDMCVDTISHKNRFIKNVVILDINVASMDFSVKMGYIKTKLIISRTV